jgi:glycine oxidase
MRSREVIVVGGGVIGSAVAFALSRMGASVLVVERDRVGAHTSAASAGMLAPISESLGEGVGYEIGLEALELFPMLIDEIRELSGIDPGFAKRGILRIAEPDEVSELRGCSERLESQGCEWVDGEQLRQAEPRLSAHITGALWSPREGHVDGLQLTRAYAAAAARRGAQFLPETTVLGFCREGRRVTGVRTSAGEFAAGDVVLCTGAWTRLVEDWADVSLPVEPVKGQMLSLECPEPRLRSVIRGSEAYLVPHERVLHVGATTERVGFDVSATASGIASLLRGALHLIPALGGWEFKQAWAGLRPVTPDHLPLVGPVPDLAGLTVAAGHDRTGILLSGITGLAVADWILAGKLPEDFRPFDPGRFGGAA